MKEKNVLSGKFELSDWFYRVTSMQPQEKRKALSKVEDNHLHGTTAADQVKPEFAVAVIVTLRPLADFAASAVAPANLCTAVRTESTLPPVRLSSSNSGSLNRSVTEQERQPISSQ